ncbi:MAG: hypothetical protein ACOYVD_11705 [Bacillota bacterium]
MEKKTALEKSVEKVLEELRKAGYFQSTIRIFKRAYGQIVKDCSGYADRHI